MQEKQAKVLVYIAGVLIIAGTGYATYAFLLQKNYEDAIEYGCFGLLTFVFLVWGPLRAKKNEEKLMSSGLKIEADVVGVREIIGENEKDKEYAIVVKAFDPQKGQEVSYDSKLLKHNPEKYLPQKLPLYLDPDNMKKYYVDISFLDKIKPEITDEQL